MVDQLGFADGWLSPKLGQQREPGAFVGGGEVVSVREAAGAASARWSWPAAFRSAADAQGTVVAAVVRAVGRRSGRGIERPAVVPQVRRATAGWRIARPHDLVPLPEPAGGGEPEREAVRRVRAAAGAARPDPEARHDDRRLFGGDAVSSGLARWRSRAGRWRRGDDRAQGQARTHYGYKVHSAPTSRAG